MAIVISTHVFDQAISWERYYEQMGHDENKATLHTGITHLLQYINIESKLYNLMGTIGDDQIWLVMIFDLDEETAYTLPILYTIASCTDRVSFKIYTNDSYEKGVIPKMVLACINTESTKEIGRWVLGSDILELPIDDKIHVVQEKLIDLVKVWNEAKQ